MRDKEENHEEDKIEEKPIQDLEELKALLPKSAMISKAYYEGPEIVLYTKSKEFFLEGSSTVKDLVIKLRKRINVRPDPMISVDPAEAKEIIKKIVPAEAEISDILFEPEFSKVIILAQKPGVVIGKAGETLAEIKKQTLWSPEIQRVPIFKSAIVNKGREIVHEEAKYRKSFLNKIGEKIRMQKGSKEGWVRLSTLGAFREIGRSCLFLQTRNSKVLLDCGVASGSSEPHPYIDAPEFRLDELDAVIVSHAHLDHCGFVPYLYEYGFKGPVYCTTPTRDLMTLLQLDMIDVLQKDRGSAPYTSKGIREQLKHCITVDYSEVCDITPDMRMTFQNAGHILGSAGTHIHVGEGMHNFLYSGDIKYGPLKLLEPASTNFNRIESMVLEATYSGPNAIMPQKQEADTALLNAVKTTTARGGKVVIPAFAVGRSQEVMMVLADAARQGQLDVPVYLDGMVWSATAIHTTYPEYLSRMLQKQIFHQDNNPFTAEQFIQVASQHERKAVIDEQKPCVIITTSGMMTGGPVMEYMRNLSGDARNSLLFVGYQAEGTLGNKIQKGWRDLPFPDGQGGTNLLKMNMEAKTVEGFSGHADRRQLMAFVANLRSRPNKVMLNHGNTPDMLNLASTLHKKFHMETSVPACLETIRLR